MCGNHSEHSHAHRPVILSRFQPRRLHRRAFLGHFGRGTAALAILGPVAACTGGSSNASEATITAAASITASSAVTSTTVSTETSEAETSSTTTEPEPPVDPGIWSRVQLGSVSAYVLARGNEIAVVDTGNPGSADAIGQTIVDLGFNYSDVKHIALTHAHPDHIGSISAVLEAAGNATAYAGTADVDRISADLVAVAEGHDILGMRVIETPGHTPGHIALFDELTGTLVAGDSMDGSGGGVALPSPRFTPDPDTAAESIKKMAQLQFDTVYFGHGEPIIGGAGSAVADLAAQL